MTLLAERNGALGPTQAARRWRQWRTHLTVRQAMPTVLAVVNGLLFILVRPDVNDLWAARARASASRHGVGLTYWFGWFGGGSTPGNYSVLTPTLSALLTPELLGAISAVLITVLAQRLLRPTPHQLAGTYVATLAAATNLWSGRIPFLLGCALGVAALLALVARRVVLAVVLAIASVCGSPVSGAFLVLGLAGSMLSRRLRQPSLILGGVTVVATGSLAFIFGAPGPQPFAFALSLEVLAGLVLVLLTRPPTALRVVVYLSILVTIVIEIVPNGMGSNLARLTWFVLPVAAVALSRRRAWVAALIVAPIVLAGVEVTVNDLREAGKPSAASSYYSDLAAEFDRLPQVRTYRVEVVTEGDHAAYDALLQHAMLARGWETQSDQALNQVLSTKTLDDVSYRVWLNNNAVGVVALPVGQPATFPEYTLVAGGLDYLRPLWHNAYWQVYSVVGAVPVVAQPARLLQHSQSRLVLSVPCDCRINVRVRYSKFLSATDAARRFRAVVTDDGSGWTVVTTAGAGTFYLSGSLRNIFG